jgi:hypothetical protein
LDISIICWFWVFRDLFYFSGVFRAEEVDGVGEKGSGDTTAADV